MRSMRMVAGVLLAVAVAASCARGEPGARPSAVPPTTSSPAEEPSPTPAVRSPSPRRSPSPSPRPTRSAARPSLRPPSPSPRPPSPRPPAPTTAARSLAPYRGLGTWVDGYDFAREFGGRTPPSAVDTMAAQGVRTLYIQAAKEHAKAPHLLLSSDLLGQWLERAHGHGIRVVAWYLPTFVDPGRDWAHLEAMLGFRHRGHAFDAVGVDIESRELADVSLRNERLVALSAKLRARAPRMALQAIVLPPVVTDVINPAYWPDFPWRRIASSYDVWSPMGYWTNRTPESGWRDAYRYTTENIRLTRSNLGRPSAVVHVIGGIGDKATTADLEGFVRGARDQRAIGGSMYDYATTKSSAWATLRRVPS